MLSRYARHIGLSLCLAVHVAGAAASPVPGSIGLYSDEQRTYIGAYFGVDPWQPFDGYLFVWPGDAGLNGFEAGFTLPPDLLLIGVELQAPFSVNSGGGGEFILFSTQCLSSTEPVLAARLSFLYPYTNPLSDFWLFTLGPASPSSIGGIGPAYFDCQNQPHLMQGTSYFGAGYSFPMGVSSLCPGPPLIAGTLLALEAATGTVGGTAQMRLALFNRGFPDCPGYSPDLSEIVLEFGMDAQIATLVDFIPSNMPLGWSWVFEPGEFGGTRIHWTRGSGAPYWSANDYNDGLGALVFQLGDTPGATAVTRLHSESHTPYWGDVALGTAEAGSITVGTVGTTTHSIGELKLIFDPAKEIER
jgi:hypothetical protein